MGMQNPAVGDPIDKFSEKVGEGQPFKLLDVRIVEARTADYGTGEMVVLKVEGQEHELGIWGSYLLVQAKSIGAEDRYKWWKVERIHVAGFGKGRPVKAFVPADPPTGVAAVAQTSMAAA